MTRFSIIIPTFDRLALLQETLQSIWQQTYTNYEVIVIDDGSTDGTWEFLSGIADRVVALRQSNKGPGAARNMAASRARSEYLAFLDSDDLWFPWTLETYAAAIEQNRNPSFLAGQPHLFGDGRAGPSTVTRTSLSGIHFPDYLTSSVEWSWWGVSSFVVRSDAFRTSGGFSTENINSEDADLAMKLGTAPGFFHVKTPCTFAYRLHGANTTSDLGKTISGVRNMVVSENAGKYPGGQVRRTARREIIGRHIRPVIVACASRRHWREAISLYQQTCMWHVMAGRWRFLAGFWMKLAAALWRKS